MELTEIVTGLTKRGIHLGINAGNIRVWPKEKLTNDDRNLLKEFKKPLLDMLDPQVDNPRSERSEHSEPNFKDFSKEKNMPVVMIPITIFVSARDRLRLRFDGLK